MDSMYNVFVGDKYVCQVAGANEIDAIQLAKKVIKASDGNSSKIASKATDSDWSAKQHDMF